MKFFKIILIIILFLAANLFSQQFDLIPNKSANELRSLKLMVVADQGYRTEITNWQEEAIEIVVTASTLFNIQGVGIELKIVKFKTWQRETESNKNELIVITELENDFPRTNNSGFDIVVGLTSHELENSQGCADIANGYIAISNRIPKKPASSSVRQKLFPPVLLHELGHIFGCNHVDDQNSVMRKTPLLMDKKLIPVSFDKKSLEKIKINKWRKFLSKVDWRKYLNSWNIFKGGVNDTF